MIDQLQAFDSIDEALLEEYNRTRPLGSKPLFCYVPFNNIFFSFSGKVISCPYNQQVVLGKYPNQSIREIWYSEEGKKLRKYLEHNDLSNGCKHCLHYLQKKKFSGLKPLVFDQYSNYTENQFPKVLEFSLENTCNLECIMCSGEVSSSIRKNRDKLPPIVSPYDEKFVEQLTEFIPHAREAKFYGGEPFMMPVYFQIWDKIYELNPQMKLFTITNGTKLNTRVKEVLERQKFEIAVSIDGSTADTYHRVRKNADFVTVMSNLEYFNSYCLKNGYPLTISFTAMRENWRELPQMVALCNRLKAHLYVSYVHKPFHLALWNLPSSELKEMIAQMKSVSLPIDSMLIGYKRFNRQAFLDFITYLEGCYEKNLQQEEEKKQGRFQKDDHEEYDAQIPTDEQSVSAGRPGFIALIKDSDSQHEKRMAELSEKWEAAELIRYKEKVDLLKQQSGVSDEVFYTLLCLSPIEEVASTVLNTGLAELVQIVKEKSQEVVTN